MKLNELLHVVTYESIIEFSLFSEEYCILNIEDKSYNITRHKLYEYIKDLEVDHISTEEGYMNIKVYGEYEELKRILIEEGELNEQT